MTPRHYRTTIEHLLTDTPYEPTDVRQQVRVR